MFLEPHVIFSKNWVEPLIEEVLMKPLVDLNGVFFFFERGGAHEAAGRFERGFLFFVWEEMNPAAAAAIKICLKKSGKT